MRWVRLFLIINLLLGFGTLSAQTSKKGKSPYLKKVSVKVEKPKKEQKEKRSDRFRDTDRDGINDTEKKAHKRRMNKSFFDTLKEILNIE